MAPSPNNVTHTQGFKKMFHSPGTSQPQLNCGALAQPRERHFQTLKPAGNIMSTCPSLEKKNHSKTDIYLGMNQNHDSGMEELSSRKDLTDTPNFSGRVSHSSLCPGASLFLVLQGSALLWDALPALTPRLGLSPES